MSAARIVRPAALVAISCWASASSANSAAVQSPEPSTATSPQLPKKTGLHVTREDLAFDCEREDLVVRCRFEARYAIDNPGTEKESVVAAFYGVNATDVVVRVGGVPSQRPLTDDEAAKLDEHAGPPPWEAAGQLSRTGFAVSLEPHATTDVVVQGVMVERVSRHDRSSYGWALDAVDARHPLLRTTHDGRSWRFRYWLAPLRTWSGSPEIHVRVRGPRGLARFGGPGAEGDPRFREDVEAGREVVTGTYDADTWPSSLEFGWYDPPPMIRNGGVVVGLGKAGDGNDRPFRLRVGWEIAAPRWLLYSANVDFDFRGRVIAAPVVEVASPWLLILPSVGFGIGLPVQVRPDVRPGIRLQLDAMMWAVGFLASLDHFPATSTGPEVTDVAFMFQFGL